MKFFNKYKEIILITFVGLITRLVLSFFGTVHLDMGTFIAWGNNLFNNGALNFYDGWSDYLPGYLYVLWLFAKINSFSVISADVLFKIPAIIADLATGVIIYKILSKSKGERWGLIGSAIYIFNPAIIANSTLWGQVDSFTSLFSLLSIFVFPTNYLLSSLFLSIGTLIKPQAAFIFPVILFLFFKEKRKIHELVAYCTLGLTVFAIAFVPFWNHGTLLSFIVERLNLSLKQYPYASINAFNFWGLFGLWKPDNFYYQIFGYLLVSVSTLFLFYKLKKFKNPEYVFLSFIFGASFMFFTRIHERHLLPVFAPLVIAAVENPILLIPYLGLSTTYIANLYYSYVYIVDNFRAAYSDFLIKVFEISNVGFVLFIFYTAVKSINISWNKILSIKDKLIDNFGKPRMKAASLPKINLSKDNAKYILVAILTFAFMARVFDLGSPKNEYFDEVYHAFTAKVILHHDSKAWEWWNTPPEGFAYEWTHPPLAKLGMYLGMLVFGENSFGYRIPGAMLGLGAIYLIYLLAKEVFKDEAIGLLSAAVFSLDGLALVMSRIGMNDSYILFFTLLALYLYIKDKNLFSAIAFGLALSSKWSAIWAIPIFGVIWLSRKKKLDWSYLWFLLLPFTIYLLSYADMFLTGHDLGTFWGMQQQMWWYHTGLRATHPYSSSWWSWPLLIRPIYLYTSDEIGGMVSRIYAFGNPFVFWFGLISVVICLIYSYLEKNKNLGLIVFSYLIFFAPWAASPRIMFIYHYLPSIPFLAIAAGYVLRRNPKLITPFFTFAFIAFVYFYPHWAGLKVPLWLDQSYYWISTWR